MGRNGAGMVGKIKVMVGNGTSMRRNDRGVVGKMKVRERNGRGIPGNESGMVGNGAGMVGKKIVKKLSKEV